MHFLVLAVSLLTAPSLLAQTSDTLPTSGACLDTARAVPDALVLPATRMGQIVRIDKVVSLRPQMDGEVIGYQYTLADGSTWLGQRQADYTSPAGASAINSVLASSHVGQASISGFPSRSLYGVNRHAQQYFEVHLITQLDSALQIRLDPCVVWPTGKQLPQPSA